MKNLFSIVQGESNRIALVAVSLLTLILPVGTAPAQSATLDFDTGTPTLNTYQGLPIDQTASGVTAHFRAAAGAFSVQTASSLGGLRLSMFSGHFLVPGNQTGSVLEIQFSEWVTNVSFAFATIQTQPIEKETPIRLTAYTNSAATPVVGVTNATGVYGGPTGNDSWPMGTLTFKSGVPFNLVRISVPTIVPPPDSGQATDFVIDNLTVQRAGGDVCTITASSLPAGAGTITGGGGYSAGLTATLTAAAASLGYVFANWTENGVVVSSLPTLSFTATTNRTLVANFQSAYQITTKASPLAAGSTSGGGYYPSGANVTVAVTTTNAGWNFVSWTEGGVAVTNAASYKFVATTNRTLVAAFTSGAAYTVTTTTAPGAGGVTSGGGNYPSGWTVSLVATANLGYAFVNWTEGGVPVSAAASYSFTLGSNRTLVANFQATTTYVITTSSSPAAGGFTSGAGTYPSGSNVTVVATANPGYEFVDWTEGGTMVSAEASYSFTTGSNRALVANFQIVYQISTSASPAEGGITLGDGSYPAGTEAIVVASANPGYEFVSWTEGGSTVSAEASYFFTVSTNVALVANFGPLLSIALATPDTLLLSWPAAATGYVLKQNATPGPGAWGETTNTVNVVGDQNQVVISPLTGSSFYRLFHP